MVGAEIIKKYFPKIDKDKFELFQQLEELYIEWNNKINVISRKDIDNLYLHHVLHSLSILKFIKIKDESTVLDLGTGGGFPGIPLAIMLPEVQFTLLDSRKKKLTVVEEISKVLGLSNVATIHQRIEDHNGSYDFVLTRAVASAKKIVSWSRPIISEKEKNILPNGIIALKGGELKAELLEIKQHCYFEKISLQDYFEEKFFDTKYLIYIQT